MPALIVVERDLRRVNQRNVGRLLGQYRCQGKLGRALTEIVVIL
jgi:hypothetical protein